MGFEFFFLFFSNFSYPYYYFVYKEELAYIFFTNFDTLEFNYNLGNKGYKITIINQTAPMV